jgi:hypothetical protein
MIEQSVRVPFPTRAVLLERGIYVASRTRHAPLWLQFKQQGWPIISTWLDEAGAGQTSDWADLWRRCIDEAKRAAVTILYAEPEDILKGALIEAGAALATGNVLIVVGRSPSIGSFVEHPMCCRAETVGSAFKRIREETDGAAARGGAGR